MHSSSEITFTLLIISECVNHTQLHRDHAAFLLISTTLILCRERHQKQRHNTEHYDQQVNAFSENKHRV